MLYKYYFFNDPHFHFLSVFISLKYCEHNLKPRLMNHSTQYPSHLFYCGALDSQHCYKKMILVIVVFWYKNILNIGIKEVCRYIVVLHSQRDITSFTDRYIQVFQRQCVHSTGVFRRKLPHFGIKSIPADCLPVNRNPVRRHAFYIHPVKSYCTENSS